MVQKKVVEVSEKRVVEDHHLFGETIKKVLESPNAERSERAKMLVNAFQLYYEEIFAFGCAIKR